MASIIYVCDVCHHQVTLHRGALHKIPFNKLPKIVLEADNHKCKEAKAS